RSFGLKPEMAVLSRLARIVGPLLAIYLAFKIGDMFIRETFVYLNEPTLESMMFVIELVVGVIIPLRMFLSPGVRRSPLWLFVASGLVILGVLINRINNFIVAYTPPYATERYVPSFGEISVTVGFVALLVLVYRVCVMVFPVISKPDPNGGPARKYAIKGLPL
ncbi:MAG TPA: Ni/Fe-hydrogenase cytochrome b subunit, partial [bacterium]|nr:Ni/Fe-hydrogenase cytochrome b subunit [bacterium]